MQVETEDQLCNPHNTVQPVTVGLELCLTQIQGSNVASNATQAWGAKTDEETGAQHLVHAPLLAT